jgi:hypothetical protein
MNKFAKIIMKPSCSLLSLARCFIKVSAATATAIGMEWSGEETKTNEQCNDLINSTNGLHAAAAAALFKTICANLLNSIFHASPPQAIADERSTNQLRVFFASFKPEMITFMGHNMNILFTC